MISTVQYHHSGSLGLQYRRPRLCYLSLMPPSTATVFCELAAWISFTREISTFQPKISPHLQWLQLSLSVTQIFYSSLERRCRWRKYQVYNQYNAKILTLILLWLRERRPNREHSPPPQQESIWRLSEAAWPRLLASSGQNSNGDNPGFA